ncbi:hypothetical protein, partial [Helicobacter typhlonius]
APKIQAKIKSKEGFFDEHKREYVKRKTLNDKERAQVRDEVIKENKSCILMVYIVLPILENVIFWSLSKIITHIF